MGGRIVVVSLALSLAGCSDDGGRCDDKQADVEIVVFRHHPGMLDSNENMEARDRDEAVIRKTLGAVRINYAYEGGMGSGFELSIRKRDLGRWKAIVDRLMRNGTLRYYQTWGLDRHGFGLVRIQ